MYQVMMSRDGMGQIKVSRDRLEAHRIVGTH